MTQSRGRGPWPTPSGRVVRQSRLPAGVTMVELIVALAVFGVLTAVVGVALYAAPDERTLPEWQAKVAAIRDSALRSGRAVTIVVRQEDRPHVVTALPDGRVIADASLGVDPLSGTVRDAAP